MPHNIKPEISQTAYVENYVYWQPIDFPAMKEEITCILSYLKRQDDLIFLHDME